MYSTCAHWCQSELWNPSSGIGATYVRKSSQSVESSLIQIGGEALEASLLVLMFSMSAVLLGELVDDSVNSGVRRSVLQLDDVVPGNDLSIARGDDRSPLLDSRGSQSQDWKEGKEYRGGVHLVEVEVVSD